MYLLIGTNSTKTQLIKLEEYLKNRKIKTNSKILDNTKEATLFIEKEWKNYERVIFLDFDAIFPFMYLSKVHKLVVATITDFYSAYMTPLHNNTKVIVIPTSIVAHQYINKLTFAFINSNFKAGRHMVRIDMLDKETE